MGRPRKYPIEGTDVPEITTGDIVNTTFTTEQTPAPVVTKKTKEHEVLATILELHRPIECISPTQTRYTISGPTKFSKLKMNPDGSWNVYSKKSGKVALVGAGNVAGAVYATHPDTGEAQPK